MRNIALAVAVSSVFAYAGSSEITVVGGGVHPSISSKYDNHVTYGIRIGAGIESAIIDQLEVGYDYSKKAKYERIEPPKEDESSIQRFYLNAIKEYDISESAKLYALLGIGYQKFSEDLPTEESKTFGQYGAGLKYYLVDSVALRAEVRHGIRFSTPHKNNLFYTLGLAYVFGKKEQEATPVVQTIAKKIPPIEEPPKEEYIEEPLLPEPTLIDEEDIKGTVVKTVSLTQKDFTFAPNSAAIPADAEGILRDIADELNIKENLNIRILIEGHTDSIGDDSYNLELSEKRAKLLKNSLIENGVDADRIIARGYGESKPIKPNQTEEGRAENRRVEIIFVQ
ncbi:MAG: OmpA family protein [Campylobacteraceae bacterium]|jgi:OOP family OmpA-OmpF porin|nr:OmpA family protein [Campylobacteraceae bacterium]